MTNTPFTLHVSDLTSLGQDRAVDSFRRLLWAEAGRVGVGRNIINVPQCINVGDGGVDAYVKDASPSSDEVIPNGTCGYQIKSSNLTPAACKKELHVGNDLNQPLKPEIKKILDADGTYTLVLFADITSPRATTPREQAIKDEFVRLGYPNPKVRLYTATQLIGFIERFPSLVAWFKNDLSQCLPYSSWGENREIQLPKVFVFDDERKKLAEEISDKLRNCNGQCVVFRITGLSGIGKTRFVYEALAPDDLKQRVIYVKADAFHLSSLFTTLQNDHNLSAIVITDECDLQQHDEFVRSFSARGDRLALITLSYEIGTVPSPSLSLKVTKLSQDSIKKILKAEASALPDDVIDRLSQFTDGYPRIGVLLAESYLASKSDDRKDFLDVSDEALMNRLIGGRDVTTDHFRKTKQVLQGLSLFSKVGYEGELSKEAEWVAQMMGVNFTDFQNVVAEQRKRGIIQGQHYIYVTPFMLRIYLLKEWWESHGFTKEKFEEFTESIPKEFRADLLERFFDHLPYIATSEKGKDFAKAILGKNGLFSDGTLLKTQLGGNFFLKLTEADPNSALKTLQGIVGKWKKKELLEFREVRRDIVWALEKIAVWKELFADAARLLLTLGEAENETYTNNASGVFADLFSVGLSSTEAPPEERLPILQEALNSDSKERRKLAIQACDKALESQFFSRTVGAEYQGVRREAQLWKPKTYGELWDAYQKVWELLYSKIKILPKDEQDQAIDVLLDNSRGLSRIQKLTDMIIANITELSAKSYGNKEKTLETVVAILHYDGKELPADTKQKWEKLRDNLVGNDFSSLMRRYVGMDLLEDSFDEDGNRVDKAEIPIKKLAQKAVGNPKLLKPELDWLVTHEAKSGYRFGNELGQQDKDFSLLPMLLDAQRKVSRQPNSSDYFIGGYLRVLFEKDEGKWEALLDDLTKDKKLASWVSDLTWRSGMSDRAALRVLELAKKKVITPGHFRVFGLGSVIRDLSEDIFKKWIEFLLECPEENAVSIALDLYQFFYLRKESKHKLPENLTLKLLIHPSLFKKLSERRRNQMDDFHWKEIGNKFVELYPGKSLPLAEIILEHLGEDGSILEEYHSQTQEVIDEIARRYPSEVWDIVAKYLGPPIDSRAFHIKEWLRGSKHSPAGVSGALAFFPPEKVWKWVDGDIEKRAWYVAYFVPKTLFRQESKVCWAREVLAKYGDRDDVRKEMGANFYTEGWSGPASLHYQQRRDHLVDFKKGENNENVKRWLDEMIDSLDKQIEHERIQEERRGF
jgi:hypothetical protein